MEVPGFRNVYEKVCIFFAHINAFLSKDIPKSGFYISLTLNTILVMFLQKICLKSSVQTADTTVGRVLATCSGLSNFGHVFRHVKKSVRVIV